MMREPDFRGDLAELPSYAFGTRSLTWWGVVGFMLIEGAGFALAIAAYFFLVAQTDAWPTAAAPPDLIWGTSALALMLLSEIPNVILKRAAERMELNSVRLGLWVMVGIGLLLFVIRGYEFTALNITWYANAYGSITWALLVLHTTHLITDWGDSLVLAVLMSGKHGDEPRRFVDTSENSLYWHFVVGSWVVIYAIIYWAPRVL